MQLQRDPGGDEVEVEVEVEMEAQDSLAALVDRWKIEEEGGAVGIQGGVRERIEGNVGGDVSRGLNECSGGWRWCFKGV